MTALVERSPAVAPVEDERDYMVLRQVFLDDRDLLILRAVWSSYRERGGCTYKYLIDTTGISRGSLGFRINGFVWMPSRGRYAHRQGGGLWPRGLLKIEPTLGHVIMPGPRLAMLNQSVPYQLVRVDL